MNGEGLALLAADFSTEASCAHAFALTTPDGAASPARNSRGPFARPAPSRDGEKVRATARRMKALHSLSDVELLHTTRLQLQRSHELDAELLLLLGEIEARRLYLDRAFPSMFDFCTGELGFSEDVAYNRLKVAGLVRRFPRVLDFVRDGRIHLSGLRLLAPHLTEDNLEPTLAEAAGKRRSEIEALVARLSPQPSVPPSVRKLPERAPAPPVGQSAPPLLALTEAAGTETPLQAPAPFSLLAARAAPAPRPATVTPLSGEEHLVKFTASSALKAKLEQAEELMRHRVGKGNLAAVFEHALDLLIDEVKKERFGAGRKPRSTAAEAELEAAEREAVSRHIPAAIKREVYARDGGQCTYVSDDGRRCQERGGLEFEHREGFARTGRHEVSGLTLHCRAHNQHCADVLYGRDFMQAKRSARRPGTAERQAALL
jgi:hypothetical protein